MTDASTPALSRIPARCCAWSERWFPDAFAFAVLAVGLYHPPRP